MTGLLTRFPRVLFFDLDGTLLAPGAVLTRRTAEAVRAAAECGATIVLATGGFSGRTHLLARVLGPTVPAGVWAVTHNGAAVWDPDGRLARFQPMPLQAVQAALAVAGPRVWVTYETVDGAGDTAVYYAGRMRGELAHFVWGPQGEVGGRQLAVSRDGMGWQASVSESGFVAGGGGREDGTTALRSGAVESVPRGGLAVGLEPRWDWRRARSPETFRRADILGCWCIGSPEALAQLDAHAVGESLHGARYLPWGSRLGQILGKPRLRLVGRDLGAREASKGAAAAWLCDRLGIDPAETAAFGDGDNDLELMAFAGTAVAMANATPRALASADLVAPPNGEDGVARVLGEWLKRAAEATPSGAPPYSNVATHG